MTSIVRSASSALLIAGSAAAVANETHTACKDLISALRERYPSVVDAAYTEVAKKTKLDSSLLAGSEGADSDFANLYSADVQSRIQGLQALAAQDGAADPATVRSAIFARLGDQDAAVVATVYESLSSQVLEMASEDYIAALRPAFTAAKPSANVIRMHLEFIGSSDAASLKLSAQDVFQHLVFPCLLPSAGREALDSNAWETLAAAPFHAGFGALKPTVLEAGKLTKAYPASDGNDKERKAAYVYMLVRSLSGKPKTISDGADPDKLQRVSRSPRTPSRSSMTSCFLSSSRRMPDRPFLRTFCSLSSFSQREANSRLTWPTPRSASWSHS